MLDLQKIELIITIATLTIVSILSIVLNGSFKSFISKIFGDDSAYHLGYRISNPLIFIETIPFIISIIFNIAWFKNVPFNPFNIKGPFRYLKIFIVYISQSISSFLLSFISITTLIYSIGLNLTTLLIFPSLRDLSIFNNFGINTKIHILNNYSSSDIVLILILYYIAIFNITFTALNILYSIAEFIDFILYKKDLHYIDFNNLKILFIFIIFSLIFLSAVKIAILKTLIKISIITLKYLNYKF
jgi:hypothetical protein